MLPQRLVLLRHAFSQKNLEDRHGGEGSSLTSQAFKDLDRVVSRCRDSSISIERVVCSPRRQCMETAEYLAKRLIAVSECLEDLRPLHLGVLDGLSRDEAAALFPHEAELMETWRRGQIEIAQLIIPKAEPYNLFFNRGQSFLSSVLERGSDTMIVGTRSILILLLSILLGRTVECGGGYKEIPLSNCCFFVFEFRGTGFVFEEKVSDKPTW